MRENNKLSLSLFAKRMSMLRHPFNILLVSLNLAYEFIYSGRKCSKNSQDSHEGTLRDIYRLILAKVSVYDLRYL